MRILLVLFLLATAIVEAQVAPVPMVDEINGRPFVIRAKWKIGGAGNWGHLALDPVARELFIAHQATVQVVDIATGQLIGSVNGFTEARSVVLDPDGQFGYVSDGRANMVVIFDRRSLDVEAHIPVACSPRSLVNVPEQNLLLAICGSATPPPALPSFSRTPMNPTASSRARTNAQRSPAKGDSRIALIDTDKRKFLGYVFSPGDLRSGVADNDGQVFITVGPAERSPNLARPLESQPAFPQGIVRFDAAAAADRLRGKGPDAAGGDFSSHQGWIPLPPDEDPTLAFRRLDSDCASPQGIAVDSHNGRLFVACNDQNLLVLDSQVGRVLTSLTTGPGTDDLAYDDSRGLLFAANGGGYGSITVIRQHVSDSYAVIQNLPTMERARTMALDSTTGDVYLVTDIHGARVDNPPANGIGKLRLEALDGSFQVLVVGN